MRTYPAASRLAVSLLTLLVLSAAQAPPAHPRIALGSADEDSLGPPPVRYHCLRILSPTVLELFLVTTKKPDGPAEQWDFVDQAGASRLPAASRFRVMVGSRQAAVEAVGFRRRVL